MTNDNSEHLGNGEEMQFTTHHADELKVLLAQEAASNRSQNSGRELTRYTQQSLAGEYWMLDRGTFESFCLPTAFYTVAEASEYSTDPQPPYADLGELSTFFANLDPQRAKSGVGWSRPAMSREIRERYSIPVVSWQMGRNNEESLSDENLRAMKSAGYIETPEEEDYFRSHVVGRDIAEIVADTAVIVTVKPGFAANGENHALVIDRWDENGVHVVDPNERNPKDTFEDTYVRQYLTGACSVIPPRSNPNARV